MRAALLTAALVLGGCATTGPEYDVPVVEQGESGHPAPDIQPDVHEKEPTPASQGATNTLLVASLEAREAGNTRLAISHLERAIRLEPKNSALWSELALAYLMDGKSTHARRYAQKAIALAGDRGDLKRKGWLAIADVEAFEGNHQEARRIRRLYRSARG